MSYTYDMARERMDRVLTVRLPAPAARRLSSRAKAVGKTPSAFVRDVLARELAGGDDGASLLERTRTFIGVVRDGRVPAGRDARSALEAWRPDRRRG